jgi:putative intracellular protease/amidase
MLFTSRILMTLLLLASTTLLGADPAPASKVYVCPMAEHPQEFDKPGHCPLCGMELVEKGKRFRVAVLVFDHAEDIDFTAPIEVFGQAGAQVFTVAATVEPVNTVFGLHLRPDYDLDHAPAADLILVPGGGVDGPLQDDRVAIWLRQRAADSRYVLSVCNGAFILAKAGLLDGLRATTTAHLIDGLTRFAPQVKVVRERVVDNGKVITAGGLSAGIDGALHVVEREYGRVRAEEIARGIEYRWQPELNWTRSALADLRLPDVHLPDGAKWQKEVSRGDTAQWEMSGRLEVEMSADAFLDDATRQIVADGWTLRGQAAGQRTFARADKGGRSWVTTLTVVPEGDGKTAGALKETMTVRMLGKAGR